MTTTIGAHLNMIVRIKDAAAEDMIDAIDRGNLREASFAHTMRKAVEAKTQSTDERIYNCIKRSRGYKPPKGKRL